MGLYTWLTRAQIVLLPVAMAMSICRLWSAMACSMARFASVWYGRKFPGQAVSASSFRGGFAVPAQPFRKEIGRLCATG